MSRLTREQIIEIRDRFLPSQGEDFDWVGFCNELVRSAAGNNLAVVYPPDGTISPFTIINLGHGQVQMGDSWHDGRIPALWFGRDGLGMGHEQEMNRLAREGETLAVVTFANVDGLDVLAGVVARIRKVWFPPEKTGQAVTA